MRYAALLEYDGSHFHGWQSQPHARNVQDSVESALSQVAAQKIKTVCAGRTDTGVHALNQVIHFDTSVERAPQAWQRGVGSFLPEDVSIFHVGRVADDFHARYSARQRCYRYLILNCSEQHALFRHRSFHVYQALDVSRMHEAAQVLVGEHDFSSFRAAGCQSRSSVREIFCIEVRRINRFVVVDVCANAFLQHMVRNIVGSLIAVGGGEQSRQWLAQVLAGRDRTQAGMAVASQGLYLHSVCYDIKYNLPEINVLDDVFFPRK